MDAAIAQTAAQNNLSVNQMLVEAKRSGLSVRDYREELRRQLIQRSMMELRVRGRINITENDFSREVCTKRRVLSGPAPYVNDDIVAGNSKCPLEFLKIQVSFTASQTWRVNAVRTSRAFGRAFAMQFRTEGGLALSRSR